MEKQTQYARTRFPMSVVVQAIRRAGADLPVEYREDGITVLRLSTADPCGEDRSVAYDNLNEFFDAYCAEPPEAWLQLMISNVGLTVRVNEYSSGPCTTVTVSAPTRAEVSEISAVFDDAAEAARVAESDINRDGGVPG